MNSRARSRSHGRTRKAPPRIPLKFQIGGAAVALLLAWPTIQISLAMSHGSSEDDTSAADYAYISQAAATVAAEQRYNDGDTEGAKRLAEQALSVSPVSAPALRVFGFALQKENNLKQAGDVMGQASTLGWRDTPSQLWLTAALIQNKSFAEAATHLDAALRAQPTDRQLFQVADSVAANPAMTPLIVDRLALQPEWRNVYLTDVAPGTPEGAQARAALLRGLMHTATPPTSDEIGAIVKRLYIAGFPADARNLWLMANKTPATPLYDGDFNQAQSGRSIPFAWSLRGAGGATVAAVPRDGVKGMALHATTDGLTTATLAQQNMLLPPGTYRFDVRTTGSTVTPFSWVVRCLPKGTTLLDHSATVPSTSGSFTVPGNCTEQMIMLQAKSGSGRVDAEGWFSQAAIH